MLVKMESGLKAICAGIRKGITNESLYEYIGEDMYHTSAS
jgi:hypothetical protein